MSEIVDKRDWQILKILCINARTSHNQIGKEIGLSKNSVKIRIENLEKKNIITGYLSIINHSSLKNNFYEILLKINFLDNEFITHLKNNSNTLVIDKMLGEWNYVLEFGCKEITILYDFLESLNNFKCFSSYEVHPIIESLKVEQLPIELIENIPKPFEKVLYNYDNRDLKILHALDKNSTRLVYDIAQEVGCTTETVTSRIKNMLKQKLIIKFTAVINLKKLGYDTYLIRIDTKNVDDNLRKFIVNNKKVRYAFRSAARPIIFIYLATKKSSDLEDFLIKINSKFNAEIKYNLLIEQYKYQLFPKGFL